MGFLRAKQRAAGPSLAGEADVRRVRIVGGGLTGILAALQAHRLGADEIELHDRFDHLGGADWPQRRGGVEIRESCVTFGPPDTAMRALMVAHGIAFEDCALRIGTVGPADLAPAQDLSEPSLAGRIAACPESCRAPLTRYARWRLGAAFATADACAAARLGIDRFPLLGDEGALATSLPAGEFAGLLAGLRGALAGAGVRVRTRSLVSPRQAFLEHNAGDVLVWAADPGPLFKAAELAQPRLLREPHAVYVFAARWTGPRPLLVRNFTAEGSCYAVHIYESAGRTMLGAECVTEDGGDDLAYDIQRTLIGLPGDLALGDLLAASVKPRWSYASLEGAAGLDELQEALAERFGPTFVPGGWNLVEQGARFAQVEAGLSAALGGWAGVAAA